MTMTNSVCLYLHVHQPYRLAKFSVFDIGKERKYFDDARNKEYLDRIVRKSYLPTTNILLDLMRKTDGRFRMGFSITGVVMEQLETHYPEVLENFRKLVKGGCEIVSESYYHSLSCLHSKDEFDRQVRMHEKKVKLLFGARPRAFRNTELMYNNDIAKMVEHLGYEMMLAEGHEKILGRMSPCFIYKAAGSKTKLLFRHYKLSDDVGFRFQHHYLPAEQYADWIAATPGNIVNLFMDFETFGEHHWEDSGILKFLERFPIETLKKQVSFLTPSEAAFEFEPIGEIDVPFMTSWADTERDMSAWLGNRMQQQAISDLYKLENLVMQSNDEKITEDWRKLQTSDHFYFMCTKYFADGDVHKYFNPYATPYEAFINFMNAATDLRKRAEIAVQKNSGNSGEAKHLLRDVEFDKSFFANNGGVFRNLKDLSHGLNKMSDSTFSFHANESKNDFAAWSKDVIGDRILAMEMKNAKTRKDAKKAVKFRLGQLYRNYFRDEKSSL
jgi:alpha-amylase